MVFPFAVLVQQLVADDMHHMVGLRIVSALLLSQLQTESPTIAKRGNRLYETESA